MSLVKTITGHGQPVGFYFRLQGQTQRQQGLRGKYFLAYPYRSE